MHSAAIDFGGTVTDLVLRRAGQDDVLLALAGDPANSRVSPPSMLSIMLATVSRN